MVRNFLFSKMDLDIESSPRKIAECRICHDEDDDSNMEIPCSCCGSLKVIFLYLDFYHLEDILNCWKFEISATLGHN